MPRLHGNFHYKVSKEWNWERDCGSKATKEREPVCSYSFIRHLKGFQHEEVAELVPKDLQKRGSGTSLELPVWSRPSFNVELERLRCICLPAQWTKNALTE
jgi:hypothetical protein